MITTTGKRKTKATSFPADFGPGPRWLRGVAILAALLPISINGLGVREVGLLAFMRKYGTPEPRILAFSLLTFFVSVLRGIIGGLIEVIDLLREGIKQKREGARHDERHAEPDVSQNTP